MVIWYFLTFEIDEYEAQLLENYCEQNNIPSNTVIERALAFYLNRKKKKVESIELSAE